jgi:fructose-1,6-bisphosphatase/inositol monophosphatase family enzyme
MLFELVAAVETAGAMVNEMFGLSHHITDKDDGTPVTDIDIRLNAFFCDFAKEHGLRFLGEEGNGDDVSDWILYVDPLDGTGAFTRGMATATVIASVMFQGEPVMAVIHNPVTGQTWSAEPNMGTEYSRHGSPVTLVQVDPAPQGKYRTAICLWPGADKPFVDFQQNVLKSSDFLDQQMGALGLGGGLIASGTLHATAVSATSAVETAAMSLIVREAGGVAIDLQGNPLKYFELGEHKGKADFLLPYGAILACSADVAQKLLSLHEA